jgi:hypothetical protein
LFSKPQAAAKVLERVAALRARLVALEKFAQSGNHFPWQCGNVGEGAVPDFARLAEGFAQKNAGRRVAVFDRFNEHGYQIPTKNADIQVVVGSAADFRDRSSG